jgi:hypothetical protein
VISGIIASLRAIMPRFSSSPARITQSTLLADEVDKPVALAEMQVDPGIAVGEGGQARQDEGPGEEPVRVDAREAVRFGGAQLRLGLVDFREDREAAAVVGLALQRRRDVARRALEQSRAERA